MAVLRPLLPLAAGLMTPQTCPSFRFEANAGIAPISETLLQTNPKIAFFQQVNPHWQRGAELACLARMTLWMPLQYALKTFVVDRMLKPLRNLQAGWLHYTDAEREKDK